MKPALLHAEAEAELSEVLEYYETSRKGLDGEFRREFEAAIRRIQETPCSLLPMTREFVNARCGGSPTR